MFQTTNQHASLILGIVHRLLPSPLMKKELTLWYSSLGSITTFRKQINYINGPFSIANVNGRILQLIGALSH